MPETLLKILVLEPLDISSAVTYTGIMAMNIPVKTKYGQKMAIVDDWNYERCRWKSWSISNGRSICARIDDRTMNLGRFIMNDPDGFVDHIDGNVYNNLESNLRVTTPSQNAMNRIANYDGVYYDKERNRYVTKIRINGKRLFLGRFNTEEEAREVYKKAVLKYHGKYSRGKNA